MLICRTVAQTPVKELTPHLGQASAQNGTFTRLCAAFPSKNAPNFVLLLLVSYHRLLPWLLLLLPVMTQSCLGALQQGCESEKQEKEDMASQVREEMRSRKEGNAGVHT